MPVAPDKDARRTVEPHRKALLFGNRLVELGDRGGKLAEIEPFGGLGPGAGFRLRDREQRVESREHPVGLADRGTNRLDLGCCISRREERQFEPGAQPGERRLQIMRDIVGDLAHAGHQPLDLVEHAVEVGGELVEFVGGAETRHPVRQIAGDDPLGRAVHLLDTPQHVAAHEGAADEPDGERQQPRPDQRCLDPVAKRGGIADIAAHKQAIAVRDDEQLGPRRVRFLAALSRHLDLERQRSGAGRGTDRPAADVPGKRPALRGGDEIEHAVAAVAGASGCHDLDEAAQATLGVLLAEAADLGVERRLGLPLDEIGARPVDKEQDAQNRQHEDREIEAGQAKGMRAHEPLGAAQQGGGGRERARRREA